jgi:DNA polymerase III subunit gamma/tau
VESPLALYRRYRPETFQEVIGQDHVTEPLRAALAANRVNHAYLFSGPRGCGKTTSARILARALNCAQAPVSDPCGECDSCRELARGGPGSMDVIEIDAASHGGVDDARDLREKAFFAPVRDRYKVYIIDEAHMVTTQGFNALLKLVEEPPPHLRFIFATTEPDKVLPTIRSRTHHYPFRLIPPRLLSDYLSQLAAEEGVAIEPAALPLVVRAGAGSARDTLSVLDQLLGGAGEAGVTHKLASDLLGFTPDTLLDEVVEAFASRDGASVFSVVDKVVETGQDPRRFTEDLLRRLRDLVIVTAVPDAPATGLIDVPQDAGERLVAQAARFGAIELSRAADIVASGLTEMRGATAPRLLLELLCARVLLPGADHTSEGVMARLERLERRLDVTGAPAPAATARAAAVPSGAPAPVPTGTAPPAEVPAPPPTPAAPAPAAALQLHEAPAPAPPPAPDEPAPPPPVPQQRPSSPASGRPRRLRPLTVDDPRDRRPGRRLLRRWTSASLRPLPPLHRRPRPPLRRPSPPVRRAASASWTCAACGPTSSSRPRTVAGWPGSTSPSTRTSSTSTAPCLTVGFANAGARDSFDAGGSAEILRQAAIDVVGMAWRVESIVDPSAAPAQASHRRTPARPPTPGEPPRAWAEAARQPRGAAGLRSRTSPPTRLTAPAAAEPPPPPDRRRTARVGAAGRPARRPRSRPEPREAPSARPAPATSRPTPARPTTSRGRRRRRRPRRRLRRPRHRRRCSARDARRPADRGDHQ